MQSTKLTLANSRIDLDLPASADLYPSGTTISGATQGQPLVYHADLDKLALGAFPRINDTNYAKLDQYNHFASGATYSGAVTAPAFIGDGSQLTNLPTIDTSHFARLDQHNQFEDSSIFVTPGGDSVSIGGGSMYVTATNNAASVHVGHDELRFTQNGGTVGLLHPDANGNLVLESAHVKTTATPVEPDDVTTKKYVDAAISAVPTGSTIDETKLVHTSGDEVITGSKTFQQGIKVGPGLAAVGVTTDFAGNPALSVGGPGSTYYYANNHFFALNNTNYTIQFDSGGNVTAPGFVQAGQGMYGPAFHTSQDFYQATHYQREGIRAYNTPITLYAENQPIRLASRDGDVTIGHGGWDYSYPQLVVKTDGKVGIGTTTPTEVLEVVGNVKAQHFIGDGSQLTGLPSGVTVTPDLSSNSTSAVPSVAAVKFVTDANAAVISGNTAAIQANTLAISGNTTAIQANVAAISAHTQNIAQNAQAIAQRRYAISASTSVFAYGKTGYTLTAPQFGSEITFSISGQLVFTLPAPGTVPTGSVIKVIITASPNGVSTVQYTPSGSSYPQTVASLQFSNDYALIAATPSGYTLDASSYVPAAAAGVYGLVLPGDTSTALVDTTSSENYKYVTMYTLAQRVKFLLSQRQTWAQNQTFSQGITLSGASTSIGTLTFSGGTKVTGLANATAATDAVTYQQYLTRLGFAGTYSGGTTYLANTLVLNNNALWCYTTSTAQPPSTSNATALTPTTFTPAAVKNAVTAGGFSGGELQGSQPTGSLPGMRFTDANYRYEYTYAAADTDGTSLAWVRTQKV